MVKAGLISGVFSTSLAQMEKCEFCVQEKQMKTPIPKVWQAGEDHKVTKRLEKVFVDLFDPHSVESRSGFKYTMDILDNYTGMPWAIPLRSKEEAFPKLTSWQKARENETGLTIGTYIFDNGELKSNKMLEWLQSKGTSVHLTAPYSSAQNGRVKQLHCTLMAKACRSI